MESDRIRTLFLEYFAGKDHRILPSFSLIPHHDPSLLLIGAGMAPLKPYFTGELKPPHPRVATCQKCVRTPDIALVGHTGRHATFFEMLGNFSFGDYFKTEAIAWAWDLVTRGYNLSEDRLWVSIYHDDDEAHQIWSGQVGVPENRIVRLGADDNFWEIGVGPCGPCSEIYYDRGPDAGCGRENCSVGCDCDRFLEIWNLVFTQFYREANGDLTPLQKKNIDTGAGLERLATVLQGASSFYETDLFRPLYHYFSCRAGAPGSLSAGPVPLRIVTEHSRGIVFMVADGVVPSNEGRGYVLRRLLRRAARFGRLLGMEGTFLADSVAVVVKLMGGVYPELKEREEYIRKVIGIEEKRFQETLSQGMEILDEYMQELKQQRMTVLSGEKAFKLYDTYGFPPDLTKEILRETGLSLDEAAFRASLAVQQNRAREARSRKNSFGSRTFAGAGELETVFCGHTVTETAATVLSVLAGAESQQADIFLDRTPFYAESGGQAGDSGELIGEHGRAVVTGTIYTPGGQIVHRCRLLEGTINRGDRVLARVDEDRRRALRRSHTATHLLHRTLKHLLGAHVHQAGSLVEPDRLRFDFTHFNAPEPEQLRLLEEQINRLIWGNLPVATSMTTLEEAQRLGAEALFGEKYDREAVRLVAVGEYSRELCGGTHVAATGEIGPFRLLGEEGIGAGVRRIEALTGWEAYHFAVKTSQRLETAAAALRSTPAQVEGRLRDLLEEHRSLEKANQELKQRLVTLQAGLLTARSRPVDGVTVLSTAVEADSMDTLRLYLDQLKQKLSTAVMVLGAVHEGRVLLVAGVTPDLIEKGIHANRIVAAVAKQVGGGGGGRPDLAQAGGKNPAALPVALQTVEAFVRTKLRR